MKAVKELCEGLKAWQHRLGKEKIALAEAIELEAGVHQQDIAAQLQEVYERGLSKCAAAYRWLLLVMYRSCPCC